ncbi:MULTISPECIES: ABC transporter substrate-binding protein [unclassified Oceanispirochaeta]|uniref:ABC transporter substrate-binding protein n=1 Tax=unclassified Oceanispirochaeta TaxID=2635722 RepID=UPI000E08E935|nr:MULTISPECIES: extracellular solute-binding protein [unclassified Oceanispirochaeta]MBF9016993.1 extracellular solute-binding protein [Oceanispirochaeta sp. M2]NPD73356.1 extracellular solute-binding protein [Oceanispirochaeta sp. M1]RDG31014.1 extracellular solute-binding protein [Oceanispirochaeta sp. M1]
MKRNSLSILILLLITLFVIPMTVSANGGQDEMTTEEAEKVTFFHYFSGTLSGGMDDLVETFNEENPEYDLAHTPVEHEAFKTSIMVMLSGGNPPDLFSYWAGSRVQFIVDADRLTPIDDVYEEYGVSKLFSEAVNGAATYNGHKYFLPLTQHYVAFFYNKEVFAKAGIAAAPETWAEFQDACEKIKAIGVAPIALGSKNRWPAQFWLDYPLLRTAGPEYRAKLMAGEVSYTDPEVVKAFELWKECIDKDYFYPNANAYDYAEATVLVGTGEAAMTLMGSWMMQLDDQIGWAPGEDYDFFPFPVVDTSIPDTAVGPFDGVVIAKDARNPEAAKKALIAMAQTEPMIAFNTGTGALAPNVNVPASMYNVLQLKIKDYCAVVPNWAFNYDLATPPPVADVGLDAFTEFIDSPENYMQILKKTEEGAKAAWGNM